MVEFSDGLFFLDGLNSIELDLTLGSSLETSNSSSELLIIVKVSSEGSGQVVKFGFVFLSDISQGNAGSVLLVNQPSQIGSSSNETVWNVHLSAKSWKPDDELNWVDVAGNDNQFGFSLLYKFSDMVQTEFKVEWSGLFDSFFYDKNKFTFSLELSFLGKSFLLLLAIFRRVLLQKLEEDFALIFLEGSGELSDGGWYFQSGKKDSFLSLESDVFGPFHESGQISGWLDVVTESEVSRPLFKKRVCFLLDFLDGSFSLCSFTHYDL